MGTMSLNETLEATTAAETLRRLAALRRTGAVRFGGPDGCTVYLHRGHLYFARDGQTDEALATALVRPGRLTTKQWSEAVTGAGDSPIVGELLVRREAIEPDLLASVVLSIVYDPLIRLFRSGETTYEFEADTVHWVGPYRAFPVDAIVAEVEKRSHEVDEWSWLIPNLHVFVTANPTLPGTAGQVTLQREDWELVTALASAHSIAQLASKLGRGQYSTARVVHRLATAGLLGINADVAAPLPARSRLDAAARTEPATTDSGAEGASGDAAADGSAGAASDDDLVAAAVPDQPGPFEHTDAEMDAAFGETDYEAMARWADGDVSGPDGGATESAGGTTLVEEQAPEEQEPEEPQDPNAVWLQNLYAKYIDDPEMSHALNGTKPKKGDPSAHQVAFGAQEQSGEEKIGTLKRLMGALKRL